MKKGVKNNFETCEFIFGWGILGWKETKEEILLMREQRNKLMWVLWKIKQTIKNLKFKLETRPQKISLNLSSTPSGDSSALQQQHKKTSIYISWDKQQPAQRWEFINNSCLETKEFWPPFCEWSSRLINQPLGWLSKFLK